MKPRIRIYVGTALIIISVVSIIFYLLNLMPKIFLWILLVESLIYLSAGWYIFKGHLPQGNTFLLFVYGYLYSGVLMASVFSFLKLPLHETFIFVSLIFALLQIILVYLKRKQMQLSSLLQLMIEGFILIIISIVLIIRYFSLGSI